MKYEDPRTPKLRAFYVDDYLTWRRDFQSALRIALERAYKQPYGGTVVLPIGRWSISEGLRLPGLGPNGQIRIVGAGMNLTTLEFPSSFGGIALDLDGYPIPGFRTSLEEFTIRAGGGFGGSTGVALKMVGQVRPYIKNVMFNGFTGAGGKGFFSPSIAEGAPPSYNNQNGFVTGLWIEQCYVGARLSNITQFVFESCHYQGAVYEYIQLQEAVRARWVGGMVQGEHTGSAYVTALGSTGGNVVAFDDFYSEGSVHRTMFHCDEPSSTESVFTFTRPPIAGQDTAFKCEGPYSKLVIEDPIGDANLFCYARGNNRGIRVKGYGSPAQAPGKWDLDSTSRAVTSVENAGSLFLGAE